MIGRVALLIARHRPACQDDAVSACLLAIVAFGLVVAGLHLVIGCLAKMRG